MNDETRKELTENQKLYWKKNLTLIFTLLAIWFAVSYLGAIILAKPLSAVPFFGVTLSFWLANQGSIVVFVILIFVYAVRMDRLDKEYLAGVKKANGNSKDRGVSL